MGSLKADDAFGTFKRNVDERSTWRKKTKNNEELENCENFKYRFFGDFEFRKNGAKSVTLGFGFRNGLR